MTIRVSLEEALILRYVLEDVLERAEEVEADNITITLTKTEIGYKVAVSYKGEEHED